MSSGVLRRSCCWGQWSRRMVGESFRWEALGDLGMMMVALARTGGHGR
jgi:hypothetical protein